MCMHTCTHTSEHICCLLPYKQNSAFLLDVEEECSACPHWHVIFGLHIRNSTTVLFLENLKLYPSHKYYIFQFSCILLTSIQTQTVQNASKARLYGEHF